MLEQVPEREGLPPELVRAIVGGIQKVIHKRLYRGQEEELPELAPQLWEWLFRYPVPPGPLKATRRRVVKAVPFEERQAQSSPPERLLRALAAVVAEKGYPDTTVAEIVERASTSQRTFYEHFKNKEDAIVAALDSGSAHMLAAALPAFRRAPDWPHAVHDTQEAMFRWGAEEPEYARLGGVEMYAAGKRALDQRELVTEGMEGLLAPGYELKPETPPIARRGDRRCPLLPPLRPRQQERPGDPPGPGPDAGLRHPGAVPRGRGGLRGGGGLARRAGIRQK